LKIEFLSTVAVIAPDAPTSRQLYIDALGLPLEGAGGDEYHHTCKTGCGRDRHGVRALPQVREGDGYAED